MRGPAIARARSGLCTPFELMSRDATMAEELPFRKEIHFDYGVPSELAPGVRRIVANNPGPFTYKGTNTYLVGSGHELALIDPGPEDDAHLEAIMQAAGDARITHVLITHTHRDHTDGLARVLAATGAKTCGFGRTARERGTKRTSPSGGEFVDQDFVPDITMRDNDRLDVAGVALTALHTPGHAPDHLCFALEDTGILFSGDHVMAWNTSVVAPPEGKMGDYIRALERLLDRTDEVYFPGHGGRLPQPQRVVKAYVLHRRMREQAILECIRQGHATIAEIVPIVYRGLDPRLLNAASLSIAAHVEHLAERGLVISEGPTTAPVRLSAA
jgi:glyoxylase-like metal-dependent hydrolase (beta-lactamase superfamily II)